MHKLGWWLNNMIQHPQHKFRHVLGTQQQCPACSRHCAAGGLAMTVLEFLAGTLTMQLCASGSASLPLTFLIIQGNSSRKGEERKTHSHWKVVKLTHITDDIILNIENPIKSTARNKTIRMSELVQQEQNTIYKNYLNFCRLEVRNLNITMEKQFHSQLVSNELSVQVKVTYDQFW